MAKSNKQYTEVIDDIMEDMEALTVEFGKAETVAAAAGRARKITLLLEKKLKLFRKMSVKYFKK